MRSKTSFIRSRPSYLSRSRPPSWLFRIGGCIAGAPCSSCRSIASSPPTQDSPATATDEVGTVSSGDDGTGDSESRSVMNPRYLRMRLRQRAAERSTPQFTLRSRSAAAGAVIAVAFILGCGSNDPAPQAAKSTTAATAPAATAVATDDQSAFGSTRADTLNGIVSDYLSMIIDEPATVRDGDVATETINHMSGELGGASRACRASVSRVSRILTRTDLSGAAKRKRVLDAMLTVDGEC